LILILFGQYSLQDGKYLVVEEIDFGTETGNPRLVMYNLETLEKEFLLDLNEYEQFAMWINDWIY